MAPETGEVKEEGEEIKDAYGLAKTLTSRLILPERLVVGQHFDLTYRIKLAEQYIEDAKALRDLADYFAKKSDYRDHTTIDVAIRLVRSVTNPREMERRNPDTPLYFFKKPAGSKLEGFFQPEILEPGKFFDYTLEQSPLPYPGVWEVLARVRWIPGYNAFVKDGPGVVFRELKVLSSEKDDGKDKKLELKPGTNVDGSKGKIHVDFGLPKQSNIGVSTPWGKPSDISFKQPGKK